MSSEPDSANLLVQDLFLIEVIFAIPPIFNIVSGVFILFFSTNNLWNTGAGGAPSPSLNKSFFLNYKQLFSL